MGKAMEMSIKPITKTKADAIIKKYHYSGKVVQNSQLNFGVYYKSLLLGAMQFGPPMDKSKILPIVKGSSWNGMMELNRMAFSDALPRFGESRAIGLAFKWIKQNAPHIQWIVSFADGTQCGHGTIYQATNFILSQIKKNSGMIALPNGKILTKASLHPRSNKEVREAGYSSSTEWLNDNHEGWYVLDGYMYRYIYFLTKRARKNYTGDNIPYSKIKELGISMYKGEWVDKE
jgi:hypothetical protein